MPGASRKLRRSRNLSRKRAGDRGERLALEYLVGKGYVLVESNYRTRFGEIDLILRSGTTLVFVEVKLRRGSGFGDPVESVTPRKQATIRALAEGYIADRDPDFEDARFDVVGILETEGRREIQHIEDAF
ncbi:YraN family protein [soil metagenome]